MPANGRNISPSSQLVTSRSSHPRAPGCPCVRGFQSSIQTRPPQPNLSSSRFRSSRRIYPVPQRRWPRWRPIRRRGRRSEPPPCQSSRDAVRPPPAISACEPAAPDLGSQTILEAAGVAVVIAGLENVVPVLGGSQRCRRVFRSGAFRFQHLHQLLHIPTASWPPGTTPRASRSA